MTKQPNQTKEKDVKPKYAINKAEGEHLSETNRRHLAREWNKRIEALDAKLSFHGFAKMMRIPASTWRREYYRSGGIRPVRNLKSRDHWSFGRYDPVLAQRNADELAAQKGPLQKLLKPVADRIRDLVKEPDRHRSLYDALAIVREEPLVWRCPASGRFTTTSRLATSA